MLFALQSLSPYLLKTADVLRLFVCLRSKPLLIVHGSQREARAELQREVESYPNITLFGVSGNM